MYEGFSWANAELAEKRHWENDDRTVIFSKPVEGIDGKVFADPVTPFANSWEMLHIPHYG